MNKKLQVLTLFAALAATTQVMVPLTPGITPPAKNRLSNIYLLSTTGQKYYLQPDQLTDLKTAWGNEGLSPKMACNLIYNRPKGYCSVTCSVGAQKQSFETILLSELPLTAIMAVGGIEQKKQLSKASKSAKFQ